jgi:hypothetical protein
MAQLTEQERQEVTRFIEAGKPLPDKHRFLLFEDKREVELVWNGKTNVVTNVALAFQVIEQGDEPRAEKDVKLQAGLSDTDSRGSPTSLPKQTDSNSAMPEMRYDGCPTF